MSYDTNQKRLGGRCAATNNPKPACCNCLSNLFKFIFLDQSPFWRQLVISLFLLGVCWGFFGHLLGAKTSPPPSTTKSEWGCNHGCPQTPRPPHQPTRRGIFAPSSKTLMNIVAKNLSCDLIIETRHWIKVWFPKWVLHILVYLRDS